MVTGEPGASWSERPLAGDTDHIVQRFRGLEHRQLVVIGEPGAGKSVSATAVGQQRRQDGDQRLLRCVTTSSLRELSGLRLNDLIPAVNGAVPTGPGRRSRG